MSPSPLFLRHCAHVWIIMDYIRNGPFGKCCADPKQHACPLTSLRSHLFSFPAINGITARGQNRDVKSFTWLGCLHPQLSELTASSPLPPLPPSQWMCWHKAGNKLGKLDLKQHTRLDYIWKWSIFVEFMFQSLELKCGSLNKVKNLNNQGCQVLATEKCQTLLF